MVNAYSAFEDHIKSFPLFYFCIKILSCQYQNHHMSKQASSVIIAVLILFSSLTSCNTAQKIDTYVAGQFNHKVPKPDKRTDSTVIVNSTIPSDPNEISRTVKTWKNLFLLVYWKSDYRHTCTLNPAIGVNYLRKGIYQQSNKLKQKLKGQQLEITIEQIPHTVAIVDKTHVVLLIISWDKYYVEPEPKEIVVSYKLLQNGMETRTGKITVDNIQKNKAMDPFQSWKKAMSAYLGRYYGDATDMSRTIVNKLMEEL